MSFEWDWKDAPDTPYKMFWAGAWRPVTNMFDGRDPSTNPYRCTAAVLFVGGREHHVAVKVNPGDIHRRDNRPAHSRDWDVI